MACVSLCKKRRPLVWIKVELKFLFSSQFLVSYCPVFLAEKVSKPVLSVIRCDGENGTKRETPNGKEVPHMEQGGCAC